MCSQKKFENGRWNFKREHMCPSHPLCYFYMFISGGYKVLGHYITSLGVWRLLNYRGSDWGVGAETADSCQISTDFGVLDMYNTHLKKNFFKWNGICLLHQSWMKLTPFWVFYLVLIKILNHFPIYNYKINDELL